MRLSRRGLILGGSAMLAGCASARATPIVTAQAAPVVPAAAPSAAPAPAIQTANLTAPPLDPRGRVRKDLMERAMAALDIHHRRLPLRDRMYLVDFQKFSGDERLYEVDLEGGQVTVLRTCHGRGSDPSHTGYAQRFSNTPDSNMSSVGAYATAGASWGSQQGPNVLLDGLEYTNDKARERAIIIHGADYADPDFLAREGKLGRSYGCFSVAHADLPDLRERMGQGRLLFAWA
ncbi:MAG: murein L,D-transpeptidase catalytic domain family protein [Brevundimonas sp.]|uniref:murein L,D-transpeptidase catalytic domain family protein n=1 Tax=Brevundimonas sp. TaxID=1871086 RepID=UPI0025838835|nr:murein L,D-transpeptidase catalytic domain family protein [Brevundimonas sp.]MCV0415815.1 murein L,D-transpeptidase catalytic domain family protein [Brevundimonas sp.]